MTARRPRTARKTRAVKPPRAEAPAPDRARARAPAPAQAPAPGTERIKLELEIHREELATQNEDLRRANASLAAANERYALLYDRAPVGYFTLASECTLVEVNVAGAALLGTPRQFLFGRPFDELVVASARPAFRRFHDQVIETGTPAAHDSVLVTVRGLRPVRIEAAPLSGGRLAGGECILCVTDESQRREVEAKRMQSQARVAEADRIQSLGTLAAGVAHDFNNILSVVLSRAELLLLEEDLTPPVLEHARAIRDAATRAALLSQQMLSYAGQSPIRFARLDLSQVVRANAEAIERITAGAAVRLELASDLPSVDGDAGQIAQILLNLVTNAAEAIRPGGSIIVRTRADQTHDGQRVMLEVVDDGRGMDKGTRLRAFDPFFTTKFAGRGLGLAVVHGNAKKHGATVAIESGMHVGTTVHVSFPVASPAPLAANDVSVDSGSAVADLVLVVDDEDGVRGTASRLLERIGYRTCPARDGLEGLAVLQDRHAEISAVLLDLTMPRLDGLATLQRIREHSKVPVVLMSGYAPEGVPPELLALADGFVTKPFTAATLRQAVSSALKSRRKSKEERAGKRKPP